MRLKTLEIKGFKSFANETVVHFDKDVIGIVGPNGSGKSNIVDAIRWVLGEQKSRELRLDQMSSVIFNGTKKRKASGMASVSLTFENTKNLLPTDYHTITITRILYRSGESEYRLNNVTCRLKDITSLFLDTGIGSNSYAIIALGMVDDILADKENARRRMFEQAAGVSKYKIRKRETLNKLKSTTDDLERVEDLLHEIEGNLATLEKQAKRTKKYFELKERYKELSIELGVIKIYDLKEKQKTVQQQLTAEEDRYRSIEVQTHQLESQLEAEKKANLDKEKTLTERQRELNRIVGDIRSLENDRKMLEQEGQFNEQNKIKLQHQQSDAQSQLGRLQQEVEHYREQLQEDKRLEQQFEDQLNAAESELTSIRENHGSLKSELDAVVSEQQSLERAVFELEKTRAINANQVDNLQNELRSSAQEVESRRKDVSDLQERLTRLDQEEERQLGELRLLEQAEEKRRNDMEKIEGELEEYTKKIQLVNRQLDARRNEYKLTKSMVENLEGFPESIKFLSQSKEWKKEAPLLSDLIYVQEDYRVAIENFLEPYLNYYVVENLGEAYEAIKLLNKTQKGKANFFLLEGFKDYRSPMRLLPETRQAIDLIETEPAYRNLVSFLLENVLVTDREEVAGALQEDDLILLSKSGRFIQRKYSISGGSIGLFEGKKIGRKKNLEVLESAIRKAEKEENKLSTAYFNLKSQLETLKTKTRAQAIQSGNLTLNQLAQEKVSLATRLENFENFLREHEARRKTQQERIGQLSLHNDEIDRDLAEKQEQLAAARSRIANTDGSYRQVAEKLSEASANFNQKNIEFIRQQNKVGAVQREVSFRERQIEEARARVEQSLQGLEHAEAETGRITGALEQMELDLQKAYQERGQKEASLTEAEQQYFQARGGINEIDEQLRKLGKQRQDLQILVNNLKEKLSELRYQLTAVGERLNIEFSIGLNDLINRDPDPDTQLEELELKVGRLRSRLDNYGEINPMAVEAYDEMKERYDTISSQRDDILQAKEDLLVTIKEIEETATAQFLEAFDKARLYFIDVFRSLFTAEDACDLILLEPDNPLESNIEIVAKPKGKRPTTINQLSGGEKTLTATALLFALYLLKPAPFCIFDEVDAPLDDANIEKFNKIIKKFSTDSQFIIVTHNKLTMAAVDTIYGVYMQEQGVSGVSAVDFRALENTTVLETSN